MRLLYICSDYGIPFDGTKGASIHVRAITNALCARGHEVSVLSPRCAPYKDHPAKLIGTADLRSVTRPVRKIKHWVDSHGLNINAVGRELRAISYNALLPAEVGRYLPADPPCAVIERLSLFGTAGLDLAKRFGVPFIVEMNAPLVEEASRYRNLNLQSLAERVEDSVLSRADAVVTVSGQLASRIIDRGVSAGRVHVVPNGVDASMFKRLGSKQACRKAVGLGDDRELLIGFSGSLKAWHGIDVLLDAFERVVQRHANVRLVILGTGPEEVTLRHRVSRSGYADAVTFTGAVPHEQIPEYLRAMDVTVAPFLNVPDFYFSPIKLFEYMAAETCVVASRLGQIEEIIEDGRNGRLCEAEDSGALARCLCDALASPDKRKQMADRARKTALRRHTWDHVAQATEQAIFSAADRRPRKLGDGTCIRLDLQGVVKAAS
ncbi:MAG: glycosyltransferase family 4 protein [Phycisphaerae bacterium]